MRPARPLLPALRLLTLPMPPTALLTAALAGVLLLAGCAGRLPLLPGASTGPARLTVAGDMEVIGTCLAAVTEQSVGGPATLRVDRERRQATLRREASGGGPVQYELRLRQAGATTVVVETDGPAATPEAQRGHAFVWSQIEVCAINRMAP